MFYGLIVDKLIVFGMGDLESLMENEWFNVGGVVVVVFGKVVEIMIFFDMFDVLFDV